MRIDLCEVLFFFFFFGMNLTEIDMRTHILVELLNIGFHKNPKCFINCFIPTD
jgi:hypothetical protein